MIFTFPSFFGLKNIYYLSLATFNFMLKEFTFRFEELKITSKDVEDLMGFESENAPEPFPELIQQGLTKAETICKINGGYKLFTDIEINHSTNTLRIENQIFSPTSIVFSHLKKSTSCILFVCTAGKEISDVARKSEINGDLLLGYVLDVIGSITVDKAMDMIEVEVEKEFNQQDLKISDRFSPGYCDWSVAEQQKLFALIPRGFCGITLSDSSLMSPIKSVSGIIGVGKELVKKGYQCNWCNDANCFYGRIKRNKKR